jgi:hypothetical protein
MKTRFLKRNYKPRPENESELTLRYLQECFSRRMAREGFLVWKTRPADHFPTESGCKKFNSRFAAKNAGCINNADNYWVVIINGRKYRNHRIIYMLTHKKVIAGELDHIDQNRQNNHPNNLRDVSRSSNAQNQKLYKHNTSGFPGVSRYTQQAAWRVHITNPTTKTRQCKYFSDSKFGGSDNAYHAACAHAELLYQEFGYTSRHGAT